MDSPADESSHTTHSPAASPDSRVQPVRIQIVGIGGCGVNALAQLAPEWPDDVEVVAVDTDIASLKRSMVDKQILLGSKAYRGLSAGGDTGLGQKAAESELARIEEALDGFDIVFIIAGMGRGTGGGAAAVIAQAATEAGALVIGFVTLPLTIEGSLRSQLASKSLADLRSHCDAVVPLPNDLLLQQVDEAETIDRAFLLGNQAIIKCVRSIHSMLGHTGIINLDFTSLRGAFMSRGGKTLFGVGSGSGEDRVAAALKDLLLCPLLHTPDHSRSADRLLLNITGGPDLSLAHVNAIADDVAKRFCSSKDTVIGATILPEMRGKIEIVVLGTTSLDGRSFIPRPSRKNERGEPKPTIDDGGVPVHASKLSQRQQAAAIEQEEFAFANAKHDRGLFQESEQTLIFGDDLDIPTFIRRGVRINL